MDVADLESKLPTELVAAVSGDDRGLTAAAQVYVGREPRVAGQTDPEGWWRPIENAGEAGGFGASRTGHAYQLVLSKRGGTQADMQRWAEQVRAHFQGYAQPVSVTGLLWVEVLTMDTDVHDRQGDTLALAATLVFHGED